MFFFYIVVTLTSLLTFPNVSSSNVFVDEKFPEPELVAGKQYKFNSALEYQLESFSLKFPNKPDFTAPMVINLPNNKKKYVSPPVVLTKDKFILHNSDAGKSPILSEIRALGKSPFENNGKVRVTGFCTDCPLRYGISLQASVFYAACYFNNTSLLRPIVKQPMQSSIDYLKVNNNCVISLTFPTSGAEMKFSLQIVKPCMKSGYYCDNQGQVLPCPNTGVCLDGKHYAISKNECPINYYYDLTSKECVRCNPGMLCRGGNQNVQEYSKGMTFSFAEGYHAYYYGVDMLCYNDLRPFHQFYCRAGRSRPYTNSSFYGMAVALPCPEGSICKNGSIESCLPGYFFTDFNFANMCSKCPPGFICQDSVVVKKCNEHTECVDGYPFTCKTLRIFNLKSQQCQLKTNENQKMVHFLFGVHPLLSCNAGSCPKFEGKEIVLENGLQKWD
eukprot:Pgem_evm1s15567